MFSVKEKRHEWTNWSGSVKANPRDIYYPTTIKEIVSIVKECNPRKKGKKGKKKIRVVGAGHSFTQLVETKDTLLSLDHLTGIISVDAEKGIAEVWAGTRLKELGNLLYEHGVSQENLGDIDTQSIAGAISTGTHGTGVGFGSLSTQVVSMTVVTGKGEVLTCSEEENKEMFKVMQLSLGLLGIIVKVTLRVVPVLHLSYESRTINLETCLYQLDELTSQNRHFEFYWFPYTNTVQMKYMNEISSSTTKRSKWNDLKTNVLENGLFWILSEACRLRPSLTQKASYLSAKAVPNVEERGLSHEVFATSRLVKFQEMEYSIPAHHMQEVVEAIKECIETNQFAVHFPIECRYVKGDDILLSSAYGRDSAYIAVHMYKGMEYADYFQKIEEIFWRYEGRPHWGKMHTLTREKIYEMYPQLDTFLKIRKQLDPTNIFVNDYLQGLFKI